MKRNTRRSIAIALSVILAVNSAPGWSAEIGKSNFITQRNAAPVSDRLIVKFKPNSLPKGLSVAQIASQLSRPLTAQTISTLQAAAGGRALAELHSISSGAHVLAVAGQPGRKALDDAIAGIAALSNVEYVEEDAILTAQFAPNDILYTSANSGIGLLPGLWAMWPATTVASPAPGATGSYGADFQTAWDTFTGTGVVVAVIDTGITPHVDIVGAAGTVSPATGNLVSPGYDFITDCRTRGSCAATTATGSAYIAPSANATDLGDYISAQDKLDNPNWASATVADSSWHGTHVAGTIAAIGNNNVGVIGGAYGAKILPVRVLGKGGGYTSDIANGIKWAANVHASISNPNPAKVINMSLGGAVACSATMQNAINAAVGAGAVVVVAAGNENSDVATSEPANCQNVISVAAIGRDGSRASYSNFSSPSSNTTNPTNVTLAAQGGDQGPGNYTFDPAILSTVDSGLTVPSASSYVWNHGTSMATPHVAAAAALMIQKNSALTPAQIKTILSASSSLTAFPSFTGSTIVAAAQDCATVGNCGAGILNANLALQNSGPVVLTATATTDFGAASVNTSINRTITFTNGSGAAVTLGAAALAGVNAAFFAKGTDTCSAQTIAAAGTCQVTVSYTPTTGGVHTATLTVPDTTSSTNTFVALTGSAGSKLTAGSTSVTATTVTVGQSTTVNLSYINTNWIALPVGVVTLSQPGIMATSSDTCSNATLAAGGACTVTVTITPAAAGSYTGTASLSLSGGGTAAVSTISGTANAVVASSGGGGGGGCAIMPFGAKPDVSLLLAIFAVAVYRLRRRRDRSAT